MGNIHFVSVFVIHMCVLSVVSVSLLYFMVV